jgi:hypothetical protein
LNNGSQSPWPEGNVERLSDIAGLDHGQDSTNTAALHLAIIEAGGLGQYPGGHQKIACDRHGGLDVGLVDDGSWLMPTQKVHRDCQSAGGGSAYHPS